MQIREWDTNYERFYGEINPQDIYRYPYSGMFHNPVTLKRSEGTAESYVYIPASAYNSMQGVMILTDEGVDPVEFLETSGWTSLADEDGVILLTAPYGYGIDVLLEIYGQFMDRTHYNVNKAFQYLVGYGKAAADAMRLTVTKPQDHAGTVCVGATGICKDELDTVGARPSDISWIPLSEVPVPVWLITEEAEGDLVSYWQQANQSESVPYVRRGITEFHPIKTSLNSGIEHQTGADLWVSGYADDQGVTFEAQDYYRYFLSRTQRAASIENGDLNPVRSMEDWGMVHHTMEVDGYVREWDEFIPDVNHRYGVERIPLVVFFHGGSNRAWTNIATTQWVKVAQARGFALAFPTGTMRHREKDHAVPHPAWNAGMQERHMDDMRFTRLMVEDILTREPIDRSRIYTSGHSMGSCMSQETALVMPDLFAACATTGGVVKGMKVQDGFFGSYSLPAIQTGYKVPVWIMMGEHDRDDLTLSPGTRVAVNVEYWVDRNKTQPKDDAMEYRSGRYCHKVYRNESGIPLLDLTVVKDKPHAFTPQDGWMFYDEWFSKFSRDENGVLYYMGVPVER